MHILITSFDPFGGKKQNNSTLIAKKILVLTRKFRTKHTYSHLQLRTEYNQAAATVLETVATMRAKPEIIISLGEANTSAIRLELRAKNLDNGSITDNAGIKLTEQKIADGLPEYIGSNLPFHQMLYSLNQDQQRMISLSSNAGSFVCNNTMYLCSSKLKDIHYGFIHVPCKHNWKNYFLVRGCAEIIFQMLESLPGLSGKVSRYLPEIGNQNSFPMSLEHINQILAQDDLDEVSKAFLLRAKYIF